EAGGAAAGVVAWPERFEEFVAASGTALYREVGDEFGGCLPSWLFLLAAGELERPEEQHSGPLVASIACCHGRRRLVQIALLYLCTRGLRLGLVPCRESEHGWCERCCVRAPISSRGRRPFTSCERAAQTSLRAA